MINPGTKPVPDATAEHAAANIQAFAEAVAEMVADDDIVLEVPQRDTESDADGRYGYHLSTADGATVHILMPGAPLVLVRDALHADAPCLTVNGEWWWWPSAVPQAAGALRG